MTKIGPMSTEEIKALVADYARNPTGTIYRLILAWIHAEARARYNEWASRHISATAPSERYKLEWEMSDWIAAVKKEVGWPED